MQKLLIIGELVLLAGVSFVLVMGLMDPFMRGLLLFQVPFALWNLRNQFGSGAPTKCSKCELLSEHNDFLEKHVEACLQLQKDSLKRFEETVEKVSSRNSEE